MIYGFDQKTAGEIVRATRLTLAHPLGRENPQANSETGALPSQTIIAKVTSTTKTGNYYPCKWCISDTADSAITFTEEGEAGWIYGLNDIALELNKFYLAQFRGIRPADSRAVFVAGGAGGGGGTTGFTGTTAPVYGCANNKFLRRDIVIQNGLVISISGLYSDP